MRKTRHQVQFRTQKYKNEDLTPKMIAKSPLVLRKRNMAGQSSALPTNRLLIKETSIFKTQKPPSPFQTPIKQKKKLSEQQIRNSSMYRMLEQEIQSLIRRQEAEFQKLDQLMNGKQKQIQQLKSEQRSIKLEIWQLRNENMQLKEAIQAQEQEKLRMMEELGISEEDFQMHFRAADEDYSQNQQPQTNQDYHSSEDD